MRSIILFLAVLFAVPAVGQRRKQSDEASVPAFTEGITYALPRSGLRIYVEASKEIHEPGPYAQYATQLLGIENVQNKPSVKWSITDVEIESFSEPDPNHVYKAIGETASLISLTPSGCLAGINTGSGELFTVSDRTLTYIDKPIRNNSHDFSRFNHNPEYTRGDSTTNFRPVRMSTEDKAVEAAKRILESRNLRYQMVAGLMDEFHPDGEAYRESLRELKKIEEGYLSLFTGKARYEKQRIGINFIPTAASEKGEVAFRFSEESGVLPSSNVAGKPVMLRVEHDKEFASKFSKLASSQNPDAGESGLFYRMPVTVNVNLIYELNTIASTRIVLPQFGQVAPIPEEMLIGGYSIEIHPETGAIKSVSKE